MRKILILVLSLLFCFSLMSCSLEDILGSFSNNTNTTEKDNKEDEKPNDQNQDDSENQNNNQGDEPKTDFVDTTGVDDKDSDKYYNDLFDLDNKIEITIDISDSELQKIEDNINSDIYRVADKVTIKITYPDQNAIEKSIYEVGIKMKGNTSRDHFFRDGDIYRNVHFKLSFAETFDSEIEYKENERKIWQNSDDREIRDDRTFFGLKKLELKWNREGDGTYSRDIYAAKVYKQFDILAQNTTVGMLNFSNQTFEGENKSLGLYKIYETIDKQFIKKNFDKPNRSGDLFKASWGSNKGMPTLNTTSKSSYGVDNSINHNEKMVTYALKTNKKSSDFSSIARFLSWINGDSNDLSQSISEYMDVNYFITFLAIQYITGDWDNFLYDSNNYYFYFDSNNLCYLIPYDMDRTFGIQAKGNDMANRTMLDKWNLQGDGNVSNLLKKTIFVYDSPLRLQFINKVKELAPQILNEENFQSVYNKVYNNYSSLVDIIYEDGGQDSPNNAIPSYFTKKQTVIDDYNN